MRLLPWRLGAPRPPESPTSVDQPPPPLDLIYTEIKARLQDAAAQNGTLESKAGFVLTAASLLISGVTGAQAAIATRHTRHVIDVSIAARRIHLAFTASDAMHALIYLWVVIFARRAYMVRKFKIVSPEILSQQQTSTQSSNSQAGGCEPPGPVQPGPDITIRGSWLT